jgi:aryl-alcohol dehydrogenase-like predicted oxidoreductase
MGHALAAPNRRLPTLLLIALNSRRMASQVALAWLLTRPTVSSVIIGARNEAQLRDNLGAIGWSLTTEQIARLNAASDVMPAYPYYPYRTQEGFARLNPPPV